MQQNHFTCRRCKIIHCRELCISSQCRQEQRCFSSDLIPAYAKSCPDILLLWPLPFLEKKKRVWWEGYKKKELEGPQAQCPVLPSESKHLISCRVGTATSPDPLSPGARCICLVLTSLFLVIICFNWNLDLKTSHLERLSAVEQRSPHSAGEHLRIRVKGNDHHISF